MRLFIGLPLGPEGRKQAAEYMTVLRKAGVKGSFTRPENLHVTLAFLGEQENTDKAEEAMRAVRFSPETVLLCRTAMFRKTGILHLDPASPEALRPLADDLAAALRERGMRLENRAYRAHLTLCRRVVLPEGIVLPEPPTVPLPAEAMVLFESHRPNGVLTYTPRFHWPPASK